jgi:hypothetical protein
VESFLPDITAIEKKPVSSARHFILIFFLIIVLFILFIFFTNIFNYHRRLFLFLALIGIAIYSFRPYLPTLFLFYILATTVATIRFPIGHKLFNLLDFLLAGLILAFVTYKSLSKDYNWRYSVFNKYVYIFIGACLIAVVRGLYVGSVIEDVLHETIYYTLYTTLFFIIFNSIKSHREINFFVWLFLITALFNCLLGITEYFKGTGYSGFTQYTIHTRVRSTFSNANIYAGFLEVIIPIAISYLLIEKKRLNKIFLLTLIPLAYINLFMTFSRGGFISALISLFLILLFRVKKKLYSFIILGFTVLVLLSASAFIARQLAVFNVEEAMTEGSIINRVLSYSGNLKTIRENPVFGIGWGARFGYVPYGYYEPSHYPQMFFGHGNSTFLDIFVHTGLIGLVSFYTMIFFLLKNLLKQAQAITDPQIAALPWGLFAGFSGLTFHLLFDGFIKWPRIGSIFWIMAGLAFANWYLYAKKEGLPQRPGKIPSENDAGRTKNGLLPG